MEGYRRHVTAVIPPSRAAELQIVDEIARRLRGHLEDTREEIAELHAHGAAGGAVQQHVALLLSEELGFGEEVVLTPQSGFVTQARPDLVYRLAPDRAIIAAVGHGGTTTGNHDLEEVWKAHLTPDAHHLFLVVPHESDQMDGSGREKTFEVVARRLGAFFGDPRREIDVLSAHVFAS